jgi:cyclopropane fatty-acyl-phospholipid synthase-like methyltransferase
VSCMKTLRFSVVQKLNEQRQQRIYGALHKGAKNGHDAVGWLSDERQRLRFDKLTAGLELDGKKILDFGCGLGAFCGYLQDNACEVEYVGIDLLDSYLKKAKQSYPNAKFLKASVLDLNEEFDYVFSSGVYAFCSKELFFEYVKKSLSISKTAYHFNMLVDASTRGYFKFSKSELLSFLEKLGVEYWHESGYLDNDVTVWLSK